MTYDLTLPAGAPFKMDQKGCARCGADEHRQISFRPFTNPVEMNDGEFTHWAICPVTREPILLFVTKGET